MLISTGFMLKPEILIPLKILLQLLVRDEVSIYQKRKLVTLQGD